MSKLNATHVAQKVMSAEFTWNFNDTMVATDGVEYALGADTSSDIITNIKSFDVIKLPVNAIVVGGAVTARTTFDTAGYDITVGDSGTGDRYLTSTDMKTAGTAVLVPTGFKNSSGLAIRISLVTDDACTAGVGHLRVDYIIDGRADEVSAHP